MSWQDRISRPHVHLRYYLTISGLPYVFFSEIPNAWVTGGFVSIDGESYTPDASLRLGDKLQGVSAKIEPWMGIGTGGGLRLKLHYNSTWQALLSPTIDSTVAVMDGDLSTTGTVMPMDRVPAIWGSSGYVYAGLETVTYSGSTSSSLTGLTRARWGSQALYHVASYDQAQEVGQGGPYVSRSPLVMRGRIATVYAAPGYIGRDGVFVSYGTGPGDLDENAILFRGPIVATGQDRIGRVVELSLGEITRLLDREVMSRYPTFTVGGGVSSRVMIDSQSNRISWQRRPQYGSWATGRIYSRIRLQRDDGAGGVEDVPDGYYPIASLAAYIQDTMNETDSYVSDYVVSLIDNGGTTTIRVYYDGGAAGWPEESFFQLVIDGDDLLWLELGFTESLVVDVERVGSTTVGRYLFDSQKKRPVFRLNGSRDPRNILYRQIGSLDIATSTGWTRDDGSEIDPYVLVGEEIFRVTGTGGVMYPYLICERAQCGTLPGEVYIELDEDEDIEGRQIVAMPDMEWPRAMRYMALGGHDVSTYGGWLGWGAHISSDHIDTDALLGLVTTGDRRRTIVVTEPTSISDIFADLMVLDQVWTGTGDAQIEVGEIAIPLPHLSADLPEITQAEITSESGIQWDGHEDGVLNVITVEDAAYNPGTGEGAPPLVWRNGTSIGTWGECESLDISAKYDVGSYSEIRARMLDAAQNLTARYGTPWVTVEVDITDAYTAWESQLGSQLVLTHPSLSDTSLVGLVIGRTPVYRAVGKRVSRGTLRLAVWAVTGQQAGGYSPCARCTSVSTTTLTTTTHYYSHTSETPDAQQFADGAKVRIYEVGNEATAVTRTVVSTTSTSVVVNTAVALTPPLVIEADDWTSVLPSQQLYCYMSDGDGVLGSSDQPYYYG